jgi:hypothetical protein
MEDIQKYISQLIKKYPGIKSVWLFGSRANNTSHSNSDWDLLAFADEDTLKALKSDNTFCVDGVDLFVVYNDNDAENPFTEMKDSEGTIKRLSLSNLEWKQVGPHKAKYKHVKYLSEQEWIRGGNLEVKILDAHRIWP